MQVVMFLCEIEVVRGQLKVQDFSNLCYRFSHCLLMENITWKTHMKNVEILIRNDNDKEGSEQWLQDVIKVQVHINVLIGGREIIGTRDHKKYTRYSRS